MTATLLTGGRAGVLNPELLESAIARPYTGYYRSLPEKCAALIQSLAGNHGFVDGNIIANLLIRRSGHRLIGSSPEYLDVALEQIVLDAAASRFDKEQVITWFRDHIGPV